MLLRQSDSTCKCAMCGMDMCTCNCIMQERVEQAEQAQEELGTRLAEEQRARQLESNQQVVTAVVNRGKTIDEVCT